MSAPGENIGAGIGERLDRPCGLIIECSDVCAYFYDFVAVFCALIVPSVLSEKKYFG